MDSRDYEAVRLNCDLWQAVRAMDFDIHRLPAEVRSKLLDMQIELREIAWKHMQSLEIKGSEGKA